LAGKSGKQKKLRVAATDETELTDRLPIEPTPGRSPRIVLALRDKENREETRLPGLRAGDLLRAMAEVAVTTDAETKGSVAAPYSFDPVVQARLLLTADPKATRAGKDSIEVATTRATCTHERHHVVIALEGEVRVPDGGLPWGNAPHQLTLVLDASHPKASGREIVLVGQNEPDGSIEQDMARLSVLRFRDATLGDSVREGTTEHRFGALPLETEKRDVYALRLNDLKAGSQFFVRASLPTDSRHLKKPARISTRLVLTDKPDGVDESEYAGRVASFKGRIGKHNGTNSIGGRDKTERKAVFRIEHDCDRPLFLKLVATGGTAGHPHPHGSAVKVEKGGGLEVRRFAPELFG
jgi:hypothetical protein